MEQTKRELNKKDIWYYSFGYFGLMLVLTTFNTFSYTYVIYVIGLDEYLASVGLSLGLFVMSFTSIMWGNLSDNLKPTKFGKRRPFLLFGVPILVILFLGLWIFPIRCETPGEMNWGVAIYYWVFCLLFCLIYQGIWAPYMAMLPEISETEENRIKIAGGQGLFSMIATIIGLLLPFILISNVEDPKNQLFHANPGGQNLYNLMIIVAVLFSIVTIISLYTTFVKIKEPCFDDNLTEERLKELRCLEDNQPKKKFGEVMKEYASPLENRDFAYWSGINFIINFGMRIPMTILMPIIFIILEIEGVMIIIFVLGIIPFVGIGFFYWQKYSLKHGLKKCYKLVVKLVIFSMFLSAFFLIEPPHTIRLIFGFVIIVGVVSVLVAMFILPNPITSEIIDSEVEFRLSEQKEEDVDSFDRYKFAGKFFGINSLTFNLSGALGVQILGFILAGGGSEDYFTISLMLPVSGIIAFFSLFILRKLNLKRDRQKTRLKDGLTILATIILPIIGVLILGFVVKN